MAENHREHAFTAVDDQPDPSAWIEVLDTMRREPAYAAYKARLAELLRPSEGGRYLEVGTGTGTDALGLASRFGWKSWESTRRAQ
jgi:ubiquinone/menaquinone biosynthesis C-methylase UbiE